MRGRIIYSVFLFSLVILLALVLGFGSNKINTANYSVKPAPTRVPQRNVFADVESVTFDKESAYEWCPYSPQNSENICTKENNSIKVTTVAKDKDDDVLVYQYEVSGGRIVGQGASVFWDFSNSQPGTYTIKVSVDDGCGYCGKSVTKTFELENCPICDPNPEPCICPTIYVERSMASVKADDTITFTAKLIRGTESDPIEYNWTISSGTIVEGQGTSEIKVKTTREMSGTLLTATVEINAEGLCDNCSQTASESVSVKKK